MITSHYDAVRSRLEADAQLAGRVSDTARFSPTGEYVRENYVILFGGAPVEFGGDRQAFRQVADDNAVFDFTVRHVGVSADAVRRLVEATTRQFTGWVPSIVGRVCAPMHYPPQSPNVRLEWSVKPPLYFADTEWALRSLFTNGS